MSRRRLAVMMIISGLLLSTQLFADRGDKGKEKKDKGNKHSQSFDDGDRGGKHDDDRWERRGDYEVRVYERSFRPPGWSRGRKVGWRDCDLPPGQAKKYGCYSYVHEGRRYYYYEDQGRIIVRRPRIHVSINIP